DSAEELVISDITTNSMQVSWVVDPKVFDRFIVQYKSTDSPEKALEETVPGDITSVDLTDLKENTEYVVRLIGSRKGKLSRPLTAKVTTAVTPTKLYDETSSLPYEVAGTTTQEQEHQQLLKHHYLPHAYLQNELVISDIKPDSFKVSWIVDPEVFDEFVLEVESPDSTIIPLKETVPGDITSVDLTDLKENTEYVVRLIGSRKGKLSRPLTAKVTTGYRKKKPSKPLVAQVTTDELVISDITTNSMIVSWVVDPKAFDRFIVQYKPTDSPENPLEKTLPGHLSTVDLTELTENTEYTIMLIGYRWKKPSKPLVAQVTTAVSGVPTDSADELVISDITTNSMKVSWVVDPKVFDRFIVQYKPTDSPEKALEKTLPGHLSTVDLTELTENAEYTVKLTGYRKKKPSKPLVAQVTTGTLTSVSGVPTDSADELVISDIKPDSFKVSWIVDPEVFDEFVLEVESPDSTIIPLKETVPGDITSVDLTDLKENTEYVVRLIGSRKESKIVPTIVPTLFVEGTGTPTIVETPLPTTRLSPKEVSVTSVSGVPTDSADELVISDIKPDSFKVSWIVDPEVFDEFVLEVESPDSTIIPLKETVPGDITSVDLTDLKENTEYVVRLIGSRKGKLSRPLTAKVTTESKIVPTIVPTLFVEGTGTPTIVETPLPNELVISDIKPDSFKVSWIVDPDVFDEFVLEVESPDSTIIPLKETVPGDITSVDLTDLKENTEYVVRLIGSRKGKLSRPLTAKVTTVSGVPTDSADELVISDITTNSMQVSWVVDPKVFDRFIVQYKPTDSPEKALEKTLPGHLSTVDLTELTENTEYTVKLIGYRKKKPSKPLVAQVTTGTGTPTIVETPLPTTRLHELVISDIKPDSFKVSWIVDPDVFDEFVLEVESPDSTIIPLKETVPGDITSVDLTDLKENTEYVVRLIGSRKGKLSRPLTAKVTTVPTDSAEELVISDITTNSMQVSWVVDPKVFDRFIVQYKPTDSPEKALEKTLPGHLSTVDLTELTENTEYTVKLIGYRKKKPSKPLVAQVTTVPTDSAEELVISDITTNSMQVSWVVDPKVFDRFIVQYKPTDSPEKALEKTLPGHLSTVHLTELTENTEYTVKLIGYRKKKPSKPLVAQVTTAGTTTQVPTKEVSVTSVSGVPTDSAEELVISDITTNSMIVSWVVDPKIFDRFIVQYKPTDSPEKALETVPGDITSVDLTDLKENTEYVVRLIGSRKGKLSNSLTAKVITESKIVPTIVPTLFVEGTGTPTIVETPLPTTHELVISDITPDSFKVSWVVDPEVFDEFVLEVESPDSTIIPLKETVPGDITSVDLTDLKENTEYVVRLIGSRKGKLSSPLTGTGTPTIVETPLPTTRLPRKEVSVTSVSGVPTDSADELVISDIKPDSFKVSWVVDPEVFDEFVLEVESPDSTIIPLKETVPGDITSVDLTDLKENTEYVVRLIGSRKGKLSRPLTAKVTTVSGVPTDSAEELVISDITTNSMQVSWVVDPKVFDHFIVQYKPTDSPEKALEKTLPGHLSTVDLKELTENTEYTVKLIGYRKKKPSKPLVAQVTTGTPTIVETPLPTTRLPPKEVSVTSVFGVPTDSADKLVISDIKPDSFKVSWIVDPEVFDEFVLEVESPDSTIIPLKETVPGDITSVDLTDLKENTEYVVRLIGSRKGKLSRPLTAKVTTVPYEEAGTTTQVPTKEVVVTSVSGVPTDSADELVISDITTNSMQVSWVVDPKVFDHFIVQYKPTDSPEKALEKTLPGHLSTVDLTELTENTEYTVKLIGYRKKKPSKPLVAQVTTESKIVPTIVPTLFVEGTGTPKIVETPLPYELVISDIKPDSFKVSWIVDPEVFDEFVLEVESPDSTIIPLKETVPGDITSVDLTDLKENTEYVVRLIGSRKGKLSRPLTAKVTTDEVAGTTTQVPTKEVVVTSVSGVPTDSADELVISDITTNSMQVSWVVDPKVFDRFIVQYKPTDSPEKALEKTLPGHLSTVDLTELTENTEYTVKLIGYRKKKPSKPLVAQVTTVDPDVFDEFVLEVESPDSTIIPLNNELVISDITPDSFKVSWVVDPEVFDEFVLEVESPDSTIIPLKETVPGDITSVDLTDLKENTEYVVRLIGSRKGKLSSPLTAGTTTQVPTKEVLVTSVSGVPTDSAEELVISDITTNSMKVSWVVDPKVFDRFIVQYKPTDSPEKALEKTLPGHLSTVDLTELTENTEYTVKLIGYRKKKPSKPLVGTGTPTIVETPLPTTRLPPKEVSVTSVSGVPTDSADELVISEITSGSMKVSWVVDPTVFEHFVVQYKPSDSAAKPLEKRLPGKDTKVALTDLIDDTEYIIKIIGFRRGKPSKPLVSQDVSVTSVSGVPTDSADELFISDISTHSMKVSWVVDPNVFERFVVQYKPADSSEKPLEKTLPGKVSTIDLTDLSDDTEYIIKLIGYRRGKPSKPLVAQVKTVALQSHPLLNRLGLLIFTDSKANSIRISWVVDTKVFDRFIVRFKPTGSIVTPFERNLAGHVTTLDIFELTENTEYTIILLGARRGLFSKPLMAKVTTVPVDSANQLYISEVVSVTESTMDIEWEDTQSPIDHYTVHYSTSSGDPPGNIKVYKSAQPTTKITITGLQPGTEYKISVVAVKGSKGSAPASTTGQTGKIGNVTSCNNTCTAHTHIDGPKDLQVTDSSDTNISLSWTAPSTSFDRYTITFASDTSDDGREVTVPADATTATLSDLEPGTEYTISLRAEKGSVHSARALTSGKTENAESASTAPPPADKELYGLSPVDVESSTMRLSWASKPFAFQNFVIKYGPVSAGKMRKVVVAGDSRSLKISGLKGNTEYVVSLAGLSNTGSVNGISKVLTPPIDTPRDIDFKDTRETSVVVAWTAPSADTDSFKIAYVPTAGGEPESRRVASSLTEVTLTHLTPGTEYEVNLISVKGFQESDPLTGTFTTLLDSPSVLSAEDVTDSSALLKWKPTIGPVDTYTLTYSFEDEEPVTVTVSGGTVEHQLTDLNPNTPYVAKVRAVKGAQQSADTAVDFITGERWSRPAPRMPLRGCHLARFSQDRPRAEVTHMNNVSSVTSGRNEKAAVNFSHLIAYIWPRKRNAPCVTDVIHSGSRKKTSFPRDCSEALQGDQASGVFTIFLNGNASQPLVYCDMTTDGGGWIVVQRRQNGLTDFFRNWKAYEKGFGDINDEFWLG
uniref:Uncharacterized protein n=1 Tax=Petromyzon marinus TaxID=7757 RepID=S4RKF2_PETMA